MLAALEKAGHTQLQFRLLRVCMYDGGWMYVCVSFCCGRKVRFLSSLRGRGYTRPHHTPHHPPQAVIDGNSGATNDTAASSSSFSSSSSLALLTPQDRVLYVERLAEYDPGAVSAYLRCVGTHLTIWIGSGGMVVVQRFIHCS